MAKKRKPKIQMSRPVANATGDEMAQVMWERILSVLFEPFIDLRLETVDLSLRNRQDTANGAVDQFVDACRSCGVGIKAATITPDDDRMREFPWLTDLWKSPNGILRRKLGGAVFRGPILLEGVTPRVNGWTVAPEIARFASGDIYSGIEARVDGPADVYVLVERQGAEPQKIKVSSFKGPGAWMATSLDDGELRQFAGLVIQRAAYKGVKLIRISSKYTISTSYEAALIRAFDAELAERQEELKRLGIVIEKELIDSAVASNLRRNESYIWAILNRDGDVQSDFLAEAFGSLGLMYSVLETSTNVAVFEAAHGTVTKHFRRHQQGHPTSTNPIASIWAIAGGLRRSGRLTGNTELQQFVRCVRQAIRDTIKDGCYTRDLYSVIAGSGDDKKAPTTEEFLNAVYKNLDRLWQAA